MDKVISQKNRLTGRWGLAVIPVFAVAIFLFSLDKRSSFAVQGERIYVSEVRLEMFEDYLPLRAYVEPLKSVYLDAVEGGRVEKIYVEEGDIVEKGQLLLELSNSGLQLDIISREAQVSEQLNDLRNTKLAIQRNRLSLKSELIETDYQIKRLQRSLNRRRQVAEYIGQEEIEAIKDELDYYLKRREVTLESQQQEEQMRLVQIEQLEVNVVQQEKNLKITRSNLNNLFVTAPRSGRLTSFNLELGETKNRGERLGQIDDVDRYKLSARISEFYLPKLRRGQRAEIEVDGQLYELELSKIYPEVVNSEFEIDLTFTSDIPIAIRRGQSLKPKLILSDREEVLLVDNGSFLQDSGGHWAFVVSSDGSFAYRRDIKLGRRNPNHLEVKQGLREGEHIVVSSYSNYQDFEKISIEE